jgi:hypothetical protein
MSLIYRTVFALLITSSALFSQYRTESWDLVPGWNAIYLNVDASYDAIDSLLATEYDIIEVWEWRPNGLDPSLETPISQSTGVDEWRVWRRNDPANSTFSHFYPNTAYYISATNSLTLSLKGKAVAPQVRWRTDGTNLVGFPMNGPQQLSDYLSGSGIVDNNTQVFRLVGGPIQKNINPAEFPARLIVARRGEAFWIRSQKFSDFYGPVSVDVALDSGLHFGTNGSFKRIVLRNRTDAAVTVTVVPTASEPTPVTGGVLPQVPLLRREFDAGSGLYNYTALGGGITVTIEPKSSAGVSLSVDRGAMSGSSGDPFASLLRVTDGVGLTDIYLPITAEKASLAGLWLGEASISKVQNQLQRFQRDDDDKYKVDADGNYIPEYKKDANGIEILDGSGNPIPITNTDLNATAQEFKLRLLLHVDDMGTATLLSQVYAGVISDDGAGNQVTAITTDETNLHADHLEKAVRLSSSNFPTRFEQPLSGTIGPGQMLTGTVMVGANHPSNPFLHTYHPDHDNKDARFETVLPDGIESHRVDRAITLTIKAAADPGEGPEWGTSLLSGTFSESVTGIHKQSILASGIFAIGKVSDIAVLTP